MFALLEGPLRNQCFFYGFLIANPSFKKTKRGQEEFLEVIKTSRFLLT